MGVIWAQASPTRWNADKTSKRPGKAWEANQAQFQVLEETAPRLSGDYKGSIGAPDQDFFKAVANVDGEITDYDRDSNTVTIAVQNGAQALSLAGQLTAQGYKVTVDGVPYP